MEIINSVLSRSSTIKAFPRPDKGAKSIVVHNTYFGDYAYISSNGDLHIENASFAPHVFIGTYKHALTKHEADGFYSITIDSPKLIGQNVSIFGDVTVNPGSVIGACSVITKDCLKNRMYVGNPAKMVKEYDPEADEWKST